MASVESGRAVRSLNATATRATARRRTGAAGDSCQLRLDAGHSRAASHHPPVTGRHRTAAYFQHGPAVRHQTCHGRPTRRLTDRSMAVCFCTLAVHAPYRQRARLLCSDVPSVPWVVLTDEPADFEDLPVRAVRHLPTGPMAIDYRQRLAPTGDGHGAAAYHDKRFALQTALREFDTAIFLDADSRLSALPPTSPFRPGLAVVPVIRKSIAAHLATCGTWRLPAFVTLARELLDGSRRARTTPNGVTRPATP